MSDLIEREKVIKKIAEEQDKSSTGFEDVAYYRAIKIIREQPTADVQAVDRWVRVKDRLPDTGERVIVYTIEDAILEMRFDKRHGRWCRIDIDAAQMFGKDFVTHWQPLPEPPKED